MVSQEHEAAVEMFRNRLTLAAELSRTLGVELPAWTQARMGSAELNEVAPTEYRADLVVELQRGGKTVFALVVEVQLDPKERKRMVWPQYLTSLRARLECPAALLVVAPEEAVARWCGQPIEVGHPRFVLAPLVLGPATLPVMEDEQQARENPELLVLSALVHGHTPAGQRIARLLPAALAGLENERAKTYFDLAASSLNEAARRALEALMLQDYEYRTDFVRKWVAEGRQEGRQEGEASAVLKVLEVRGLKVDAQARERIMACMELEQLSRWLCRAVTVQSVPELFAPEPDSPPAATLPSEEP